LQLDKFLRDALSNKTYKAIVGYFTQITFSVGFVALVVSNK